MTDCGHRSTAAGGVTSCTSPARDGTRRDDDATARDVAAADRDSSADDRDATAPDLARQDGELTLRGPTIGRPSLRAGGPSDNFWLVTTPRTRASALLSKGVVSAGWNSILTGLVLLYVGWMLGSTPLDQDPFAGHVGVGAFLAGAWMFQRGLRSEFMRRPRTYDVEPNP